MMILERAKVDLILHFTKYSDKYIVKTVFWFFYDYAILGAGGLCDKIMICS
jgi:hypothetical protein